MNQPVFRMLALAGVAMLAVHTWLAFALYERVDAIAVMSLVFALWASQGRRSGLAGAAIAGLFLSKFYPVVVAPALYRRWDWRAPLAFAVVVCACYAPYLGVGAKVFGFLGGHSDEEGLRDGSGLYPWVALKWVIPTLPDGWAAFYPLVAAGILTTSGLIVLARDRNRDFSMVGAFALASATTVLISRHYAWYFAWLVPFLAFVPSPGVIWLTSAAAFFEPVEWPDDFVLASAIYVPFLVLISLELGRRLLAAPGAREEAPEIASA